MQSGLQCVIVGIAVAVALIVTFASLAPFRWRLTLATVLEGWLPSGLVSWLQPRGGCGACGGGAPRAAR